ncbi:TPM domain-containing protein [Lacisediminihabitans profunda]|uniref:TPM domain-containing protein n=1 Tax=Lacisediminihabitans profunda TaxID=2594790 RepID=A0A5C8UUQ8_9MICO|nr:TPM domain-containing protein [Lacisediminihabitans profunda]TXN31376.1 TPM domain-containing protein [Lacisediminihabitans profunda]
MRNRLFATLAAVAIALGIGLVAPTAAVATPPVDLAGGYVVDQVGALGGRQAEVNSAIDKLYADSKVQLFVVYVDSFTGVSDPQAWAAATARKNGLGKNNILLAVAVSDRVYNVFYDGSVPLSAQQTDSIETNEVVPKLKADDWAGAAIAAADGFDAAMAGGSGGTGSNGTGSGGTGSAIAGGALQAALVTIVVIIVLLFLGLGLVLFIRSRRRRAGQLAAARTAQLSLDQLDAKASSLLVQLDDSLKSSEQELGFAIAQFGNEVTTPFSATLAKAQAEVKEAFAIKQKLDDAVPETPEEKRAMTTRIIELCETADRELDEQADAFDDLRELEKSAPQDLEKVVADASAAATRLAASREKLAGLASSYSPKALATVATNPEQADKLLAFVDTTAATARDALAKNDLSTAAVNVRAGQASLGQTAQLLDAIDSLALGLADAKSKLDAAITDTRQDLATAKALPAAASDELAPSIAAAETALAAATEAGNAGDPLSSLGTLGTANAQLDRVLDAVRDEQEKVRTAAAQLPSAISTASSQISAANDFITTRRGGVGSTARTRVSEATRHLEVAVSLSSTDPVQALTEATAAIRLSREALSAAQDDVDSFQGPGAGGGSGLNGIGGAILGGIIGGLLSGGGRGGGFGGGGFGGFGGGGFGGGGFGGGGFGGGFGGSGGGRSSGGGFGGGGRSSGGRF